MSDDKQTETNKSEGKTKSFSLRFLVTIAVLIKFIAWPLIHTSYYEFKHRSGHGWDDSRADFQKYYEEGLQKFSSSIPAKYATDLASCQANSYVGWLNKSGCRSYRISLLTSAAEHEKRLIACLSKAGDEAFAKDNTLNCVKQIVPNKWTEFESVYATRFLMALKEEKNSGVENPDDKLISVCMAKKYVEKQTSLASSSASNCGPMNLNAENLQSLLAGTSCQEDAQDVIKINMPVLAKACARHGTAETH